MSPDPTATAACVNTEPPPVRCYMGHRCRWLGNGWIECRKDCCWSSCNRRQCGPWRWLRVMLGV